jgi:predicted nucleic acid-binding protein
VPPADAWVVDASVLVDLTIGGASAAASAEALAGRRLHAPAHVDLEVASALARLQRSGLLTKASTTRALNAFARAPLERHDLPPLVPGAWKRSASLRVADALYVELAHQLGARVLTIDARLARASTYAVLPPGLPTA